MTTKSLLQQWKEAEEAAADAFLLAANLRAKVQESCDHPLWARTVEHYQVSADYDKFTEYNTRNACTICGLSWVESG